MALRSACTTTNSALALVLVLLSAHGTSCTVCHLSACSTCCYSQCHRSGEVFENLFCMRMVRGANDEVRFAMGAQLSRNASDGELQRLLTLLYLLPTKLISGGSAYQQDLDEQEAREKGDEMLKTVDAALYAREAPKRNARGS